MGNKFYCTGTTGTLILEALKEKHPDEEWDFTILKSGPLGGDQQMGSRIVDGQIDYLFFFTDPMTLQPHDTDVKALTRLSFIFLPSLQKVSPETVLMAGSPQQYMTMSR